ncbi:MAG: kelch repeat-containing protein [Planctomycetota bacterium]
MNSRGLGTTLVCGIGLSLLGPPHQGAAEAAAFDQTPPAPSPGAALCYDAARRQWVAFGGRTSTGVSDEVAIYDAAAARWSRVGVDPDSPQPPARAYSAAVVAGEGALLIFGGEDDGALARDDTWVFDFVSRWWWQFTPQPGDQNPDPRVKGQLSYDVASGAVVLRGGLPYRGGPPLADCWQLDREARNWVRVW